MGILRAFLLARRRSAMLLLALALCMKALVPAGYMVAAETRLLSVVICADASAGPVTKQIAIPMDRKHSGAQHKADGACAFTALGHATLGSADAALMALVLAFILALGFAAAAPLRLAHNQTLRPPLRGPPAFA